MARVTRSIQYRYLNREMCGIQPSTTLMSEIRSAMQSERNGEIIGESVLARVADLEQGGQKVVLNEVAGLNPEEKALSGQLVLYVKGNEVQSIEEELQEGKNSFKIVPYQMYGPSKPVKGLLYFVVMGNHLGMISSNVVNDKLLGRYLTWLLKDITGIIKGESHIELNAQISIDTSRENIPPAQEFTIHAQPNQNDEKSLYRFAQKAKGAGRTVLEVLKTLGCKPEAIEKLEESIPVGGTLEGSFRVFIKEGRKRVKIPADMLKRALQNIDEESLEIKGFGGQVSDGLLKLSEPVSIKSDKLEESWLDPEDAIAKILTQMDIWANQGNINLIDGP